MASVVHIDHMILPNFRLGLEAKKEEHLSDWYTQVNKEDNSENLKFKTN